MIDNLNASVSDVSELSIRRTGQAIGAAIGSALVPGFGQFVLGEKRRACVFFSLLLLWFWLFLPPFRVPRYYPGLIFAIFAGAALTIAASCQALRSQSRQRRPGSYWWLLLILPLAFWAACVTMGIALRVGGFRYFKVPSTSMEPTIIRGDSFLADMRYYRVRPPQDGDIVLFHSPATPGVIVIKRVIAVGGEVIQSAGGQAYLNGKALSEPYAEHIDMGNAPRELMDFGPTTVPPEKLFVMGDNRDVSLDSRTPEFGLVDKSVLMGKALYFLKSPNDRTGKPIR